MEQFLLEPLRMRVDRLSIFPRKEVSLKFYIAALTYRHLSFSRENHSVTEQTLPTFLIE